MAKKWVVVYDISRDENRHRVARILRTVGFHIQRSAFYIEGMSQSEVQKLVERLKPYVDTRTDRLFIYPVEELEFSDGYPVEPWKLFIL